MTETRALDTSEAEAAVVARLHAVRSAWFRRRHPERVAASVRAWASKNKVRRS